MICDTIGIRFWTIFKSIGRRTKQRRTYVSFKKEFAETLRRGVEVRVGGGLRKCEHARSRSSTFTCQGPLRIRRMREFPGCATYGNERGKECISGRSMGGAYLRENPLWRKFTPRCGTTVSQSKSGHPTSMMRTRWRSIFGKAVVTAVLCGFSSLDWNRRSDATPRLKVGFWAYFKAPA